MTRQQVDPDAARASAVALDLRVLMGKLRRRLRETGHAGDLTWSQTSVLAHLESEGPATVTTLARAQGVRPQSMGANVAVLEAAELISGAPDPTDGRQTILSLTAAAREEIKSGRTAKEDWLARPCPIARADHLRWCPARRYARPHCQSIRHRCGVRRRRHHHRHRQRHHGVPAAADHARPAAGEREQRLRIVGWGTMPLGAAVGGLLAQLLGLRAVFAIMALLILALLAVMTMLTDQAIDAADRDGGSP